MECGMKMKNELGKKKREKKEKKIKKRGVMRRGRNERKGMKIVSEWKK